jgi:putative NADH-flavin reductase
MKLFVVGASGRTGRQVIRQALTRGHSVAAIVRHPGSLDPHQRLQIVTGNPLDADHLTPILAGHDAVISCLGQRSRADASLLQDAAAAMLTAMNRIGVRRNLVVSQGLLFPGWSPPRLLEGGVPRGYRIKVGTQPEGTRATQRADLATFLLDEAERREHPREIVGITSP